MNFFDSQVYMSAFKCHKFPESASQFLKALDIHCISPSIVPCPGTWSSIVPHTNTATFLNCFPLYTAFHSLKSDLCLRHPPDRLDVSSKVCPVLSCQRQAIWYWAVASFRSCAPGRVGVGQRWIECYKIFYHLNVAFSQLGVPVVAIDLWLFSRASIELF